MWSAYIDVDKTTTHVKYKTNVFLFHWFCKHFCCPFWLFFYSLKKKDKLSDGFLSRISASFLLKSVYLKLHTGVW